MKYKRIKENMCVGKTIAQVYSWCEHQLFIFTDDTYLCLKAEEEYENVSFTEIELGFYDLPSDDMIKLGFFTLEEYKEEINKKKLQNEDREKQLRREAYLRLKKEFEPE